MVFASFKILKEPDAYYFHCSETTFFTGGFEYITFRAKVFADFKVSFFRSLSCQKCVYVLFYLSGFVELLNQETICMKHKIVAHRLNKMTIHFLVMFFCQTSWLILYCARSWKSISIKVNDDSLQTKKWMYVTKRNVTSTNFFF